MQVQRRGKKWIVVAAGYVLDKFDTQRDAEVYAARVKADMFKFGKELAKR
jgi:hypothetical protein